MTGASASRSPDRHAGWYNHALTVTFAGHRRDLRDRHLHADELLRPRLAERVGHRHLPRPGGNTSASSNFGFQYDDTGPAVTATPSRSPDANGWYNHRADGQPSAAPTRPRGSTRCSAPQNYSGPDNANASVTGSCIDRAGNSTQRTFGLSYDLDGAAGDRVDPVAEPGLERLVQPRVHGHLRGHGRDVGDRLVHADDVLGA